MRVPKEKQSDDGSKKVKDVAQSEQAVCRICLGDENTDDDPLITPCKCQGTMGHIHIECLRDWLNSRRTTKENLTVKTYCWKALDCELCKTQFPDRISAENGKFIELVSYEKPDLEYFILESVTSQNIKIIHVIYMANRTMIKVGRGHDCEIRITDISVSRFHALFKKNSRGDFILEDNNSKFGTLSLVRRPVMLDKSCINYFQVGRTILELQIKEPGESNFCNCFGKKKKV